MKSFKLQIVFVFILGLLPSLFLANSLAYAQAGTGVIRVAATGADSSGCGSVTVPCRTIQYAVNLAAAGDEIHIAQGTYSDVNSHATPGWYEWPATIQQIVYLDKSVTLKGGYNAAFSARDSDPNLTVLDAQGQGRGIAIMPDVTVIVDGLRVTGGDNANQGGAYDEFSYYDVGAGIYIRDATVTIDNCQIDNNVSSQDGGGIYVYQGDVNISNSGIESNQAAATIAPGTVGFGGGVFLDNSSATLTNNVIRDNAAEFSGGGIEAMDGSPTIQQNQILSNTARVSGGGINLLRTSSVVEANTIQGNVVEEQDGGGIALWSDQSTVHDNIIQNNQADDFGAGIAINKNIFDDEGSVVIITYNTIANNHAPNGTGAAITLLNSDATIQHNTVISNSSLAAWTALLANKCNLTLGDNLFQGNTNTGAGFSVQDTAAILRCQATLDNNRFVGNVNHSHGSVLKISASSVSGQNNIIAGNSAPGRHIAGLEFYSATATLRHTTIAHNNGMQSFGIHLDGEILNQVTLQNTIVASHTAGVRAFDPQGITMDGVLWYSVTQQTHEDAVITASHAYTGSPAFVNPAALDFHITGASAARDRGIDAGVSGDIDGDPRPLGAAPDLGADEYIGPPVISDLRVVQGQVTTATVTVALAWTPPAEAISTTIRYNIGGAITEETWAAAVPLTDTLPEGTSSYVATMPNPSGTVDLPQMFYFAAKYQTAAGEMSGISNTVFYPERRVYLPLVSRD